MKTQSLVQAIEYVVNSSAAQKYIQEMEAPPPDIVIAQISATVINYIDSIIQVIINFRERNNPNDFNEDAVVDVRGTNLGDFKILHIQRVQKAP